MGLNFLHGSDFHLGYVQYGLHERFVDFARTFKEFIRYGLEHEVDFILIAGDLFEKRNINAPTYLQAYKVLSWLQEECEARGREPIPVIAIEGNHDLAYHRDRNSWLQILESQGLLRLLKSSKGGALELDYVDVGGCRIFGVEYLGALALQSIPQVAEQIREINQGDEKFTVLMMHFGMEGYSKGEMAGELPYNALLPLRECVDYLALGHYHSQYDYDGWVYNGGSPEVTSFAEVGRRRGFYHVSDGSARLVTLPTRPFKRFSVDISGVKTPGELSLLVQSLVENEPPVEGELSPIVELTLWGNLNFPKKELSLQSLKEIISSRFDCLHVEVQLKYTGDDYTLHEDDVRGLSREQIEAKILREQILKDGRFREHVEQVVRDVMEVKRLALLRAGEREILHRLKQSLAQMRQREGGDSPP
jgi:DNA repair exonuclease SbcCD nuclease subunit